MKIILTVALSLFSLSYWAHADFTISGTVTHNGSGLAGVVLEGLPGPPVTDSSGHYSVNIEYPVWTDSRVTPTLSGYGFDPRYTDYFDVSSDTVTDYEAYDAGFRLDFYPIPPEYDLGGLLVNVIPIDFDHDGFLDIVAAPFSPHEVMSFPCLAYVNDGTGRFVDVTAAVLGGFRTYGGCVWSVADFDGDGYDDLFAADPGVDFEPWGGGANHLLMGRADGTLINEGALRLPAPREVAAYGDWGDVDGDDDVDILICGTGGWYNLLINDGNGYFAYDDFRMPPQPPGHPGFRSNNGRLIDIDRDGDLDAFFGTGSEYADRDALLINDGKGYFQFGPAEAIPLRIPGSTMSKQNEEGDIDGDGWPDILVWTDVGLQLLINNGDGTFRDGTHMLWQPASTGLHGNNIIGDLNGDGWQDMILSHGEIRYHVNHGGNSFEDVTDEVFPARPVFTNEGYNTLADVDNDGDLDILGSFDVPHGIYVLVNVLAYSVPEPPLPLPEAPFLLSPADGVTIPTIDAPLGWTAVTAALAYRLQVALDPSFSQIVRDRRDLTFNAFSLRGLSGNTTYFWRVRALNARGDSPWTEAWSFTTPHTVTVSGTVTCQGAPFGGARMLDLPGQPVTDLNGHYETEVEIGWSGTARPIRSQYNFVPETTSYVNVVSAQTTDYVAYIGIPQHERQALIAFYNATGGDNWTDKSGWKEPPLEADGFGAYGSEGNWFGVGVDIMNPPYMYPVTVIRLIEWDNNVDGVLPANIGDLTNMVDFRINGALRGTLPASMASFTKLVWFIISNTDLEGGIPAWLGNNPNLMNLELSRNRLSGTIPPDLGNCTNLRLLYISDNMFVGPIPGEFMNLVNLSEGTIGNNALFAAPAVQAFVESHLGTMGSQTLAPTAVTAVAQSGTSILISWTFANGFPGYNVSYSTDPGGPYAYFGSAEWWESSLTVDGLSPGTTYYFVVQSYNDPTEDNKNTVVSTCSAEASATTPALISLTVTAPNGGEAWPVGTSHDVTWTQTGLTGSVTVKLYKGGEFIKDLGTADVEAGTFSWAIDIDQVPGEDYRIQIWQGTVLDGSNEDFSILASPGKLRWFVKDVYGYYLWMNTMLPDESFEGWLALQGGTSTAAATAVFNGELHNIVKDAFTNILWHQSMDGEGTWSGWTMLGGESLSTPSMAVFNNKLYVAIQEPDNRISCKSMDAEGTWSEWAPFPGATSTTPVLASFNGKLHLVVKDLAFNFMWWNSMDATETWSGWQQLSGESPSPVAMAEYNGKLYMFVRGNTDDLYFRSMDTTGAWGPWTMMVGATSIRPTVAAFNGRLYLVVKDANGYYIWMRSMDETETFGDWTKLPGGTEAPIALVVF